ncbi:MAG: hypothetical protein AAGI54_00665 [Planctomycetota bacterium]
MPRERQLSDAETALLYGQAVSNDAPAVVIPGVNTNNWGPDIVRTFDALTALALLADNLRPYLTEDDAGATVEDTVALRPGRCTLGSTAFDYAGSLTAVTALTDNDTTYIWAEDSSGFTIASAIDATGWPGTAHLKLASVTRTAGVITDLTDLRAQAIFTA